MDFFESQAIANRNTRKLVFLFAAAVASLVALTNGLVYLVMRYDLVTQSQLGYQEYNTQVFLMISGLVIGIVSLASFYRVHSLKKGGSAVAEMMGGVLLVDDRGDLNQRKLLNVVEEMAIASGIPVPPVYVLPEDSINAFAAGYAPADAVIGVTRGAINNLDREELQGVIAHEFSHILNGDMRLNIRLTGILYGIIVIALVGRMLTRVRVGRSKSSAAAGVVMVGVGLLAIGYLGQFFCGLIKAAVSRQREFLADASAVQFTRNPQGLAGALKRIGGVGSIVLNPEGEEVSHMLFADGIKARWFGLMATHPQLDERIRRIEPRWDGSFATTATTPPDPDGNDATIGFAQPRKSVEASEALASVGTLTTNSLTAARQILASTADVLKDAARQPYSARAVVYCLLLDKKPDTRIAQLQLLSAHADEGVYAALQQLLSEHEQIQLEQRMPLLEIAMGTLRQLSVDQYRLFVSNMDALIRADGRIGLQEWVVKSYVTRSLNPEFGGPRSGQVIASFAAVRGECRLVLSLLAHADLKSKVAAPLLFSGGASLLELNDEVLPRSGISFKQLDAALDRLALIHPLKKPLLLKACIATAAEDGKMTAVEREVIRVIAAALDCPMPPIKFKTHIEE